MFLYQLLKYCLVVFVNCFCEAKMYILGYGMDKSCIKWSRAQMIVPDGVSDIRDISFLHWTHSIVFLFHLWLVSKFIFATEPVFYHNTHYHSPFLLHFYELNNMYFCQMIYRFEIINIQHYSTWACNDVTYRFMLILYIFRLNVFYLYTKNC